MCPVDRGRFVMPPAPLAPAPAPPVNGNRDAARLIEMERDVLRSMSSCGWFFDDIAGIEARQVLRYAAHAIALAGAESARLEAGFIEKLGDDRNVDVFRQTLQPTPS